MITEIKFQDEEENEMYIDFEDLEKLNFTIWNNKQDEMFEFNIRTKADADKLKQQIDKFYDRLK